MIKQQQMYQPKRLNQNCVSLSTHGIDNQNGSIGVRNEESLVKTAKDKSSRVPIFLEKTFNMIDTCNPAIASWSRDGKVFIVKNVELFASRVIPQFFKHNNFASFVRQLNFYRFRKVKANPIKISTLEDLIKSKYWCFHHKSFQQGRHDLLVHIKKISQSVNTPVNQKTVESMKNEMAILKEQVATMSEDILRLTSTVETLLGEREAHTKTGRIHSKKRNSLQLGTDPLVNVRDYEFVRLPPNLAPEFSSVSDEDLLLENVSSNDKHGDPTKRTRSLPPSKRIKNRIPSSSPTNITTTGDKKEKIHRNEEQSNISREKNVEVSVVSSSMAAPMIKKDRALHGDESILVQKIGDAISILPIEMQKMCVERLVASMQSPGFINRRGKNILSKDTTVIKPRTVSYGLNEPARCI